MSSYWLGVILQTLLAAAIIGAGHLLFNRFEERTSFTKRLRKMVVFVFIAASLSATVSLPWSLFWIIGMPVLGLCIHFWWCRKHGIHPFTAQPRDKYYQLRGWAQPDVSSLKGS